MYIQNTRKCSRLVRGVGDCCLATFVGLMVGMVVALGSGRAAHADPALAEVPWGEACRIVPASLEAARATLGREDLFTRALSRFDRESRMVRGDNPSDAEFRRFAAEEAREWDPEAWRKIRGALQSIRGRLADLPPLPWPREILFIATTGREEGDAAYCRGAAVILPASVSKRGPDSLERLVAHELFHVLSNQNPEWRRKVYAVIGFAPCPEVPLPPELRDRKITNPDGPRADCRLELTREGRVTHVVPVLFANVDRYDAAKGGSFFAYLTFRLLVVENAGPDQWRPVQNQGRAELLDPKATPEYGQRIGANTSYIIHPDETMADNFVHLLFRATQLPNPEIVARLREALVE